MGCFPIYLFMFFLILFPLFIYFFVAVKPVGVADGDMYMPALFNPHLH